MRTGRWPARWSGPVIGIGGETWYGIDSALKSGRRGLPGGSSLAVLAGHRGLRNPADVPRLSVRQVLEWVEEPRERTGRWPTTTSGPIHSAPGETWLAVDRSLRVGSRGLRGGSSLSRLLAEKRGVRNHRDLPRLTVRTVLAWADRHFARNGRWPVVKAGAVEGVLGQTWSAVDAALTLGLQGLPGGDSLARLLARHRGDRRSRLVHRKGPSA